MIPTPLSKAEADLVRQERDLPILELIKGASDDELRAFRCFPIVNEGHYHEKRLSWLDSQRYLLGITLGRDPTDDELQADNRHQNLRFQAYYVMSYWSMVTPLCHIAHDKLPPLIRNGRGDHWIPQPLTDAELPLVHDRSHIALLEIIKGFTRDELKGFDEYQVGAHKDYYHNQTEWIGTTKWLLGVANNRDPSEDETMTAYMRSNNFLRYRAFYVLHHPHKVTSITRRHAAAEAERARRETEKAARDRLNTCGCGSGTPDYSPR